MSGLVVIGSPQPAHAHIELVGSSPELGAEVPLGWNRIRLVFGDDLFPVGNDVIVRGPDGADVTSGEPAAFGSSLETPIGLATSGRHLVSYRVVGQDGHPITGDLWFTAVADGLPLPSATAARQAGAAGDAIAPASGAIAVDASAQTTAGVTTLAWFLAAALGLASVLVFMRGTRAARLVAKAPHRGAGRSPRSRDASTSVRTRRHD